jgi:hypothetical protein
VGDEQPAPRHAVGVVEHAEPLRDEPLCPPHDSRVIRCSGCLAGAKKLPSMTKPRRLCCRRHPYDLRIDLMFPLRSIPQN